MTKAFAFVFALFIVFISTSVPVFAASQHETVEGYASEIVGFFVKVIIAVGLELAVAVAFGYRRKKEVKLILIVNIATQLFLNIAVNIADFRAGALFGIITYIGLEFLIFIFEAAIYAVNLPGYSGSTHRGKAVLYAFCANLTSFIAGGLLAAVLGGISDFFTILSMQ